MVRSFRIREIRDEKFLTQAMLSEMTGLRIATISRLEAGLQAPRVSRIRTLAAALDIEPSDLFDTEDPKPGADTNR